MAKYLSNAQINFLTATHVGVARTVHPSTRNWAINHGVAHVAKAGLKLTSRGRRWAETILDTEADALDREDAMTTTPAAHGGAGEAQ